MPNPFLERFPQLRRITNQPQVRQWLSIGRQYRLVGERFSFIARELLGGVASYHLAAAPGHRVVLRHRTRDMEIFDEIFRPPPMYELPHGAATALAAVAAQRPIRILDLGGNIGLFGVDALVRYPSAEVTSYEPDPANLEILRRAVEANSGRRWTVVEACALASGGPVRIDSGRFADSHVSDVGTPADGVDILPLLDRYDYIKMDIEGSEWLILTDSRWSDATPHTSVLVLEWHQVECPVPDGRAHAIAAVSAAGFTWQASEPGWPAGLIWAWRS